MQNRWIVVGDPFFDVVHIQEIKEFSFYHAWSARYYGKFEKNLKFPLPLKQRSSVNCYHRIVKIGWNENAAIWRTRDITVYPRPYKLAKIVENRKFPRHAVKITTNSKSLDCGGRYLAQKGKRSKFRKCKKFLRYNAENAKYCGKSTVSGLGQSRGKLKISTTSRQENWQKFQIFGFGKIDGRRPAFTSATIFTPRCRKYKIRRKSRATGPSRNRGKLKISVIQVLKIGKNEKSAGTRGKIEKCKIVRSRWATPCLTGQIHEIKEFSFYDAGNAGYWGKSKKIENFSTPGEAKLSSYYHSPVPRLCLSYNVFQLGSFANTRSARKRVKMKKVIKATTDVFPKLKKNRLQIFLFASQILHFGTWAEEGNNWFPKSSV